MGIKGTYLNLIKVTYDKLTGNIILNTEKLKAFFRRSGTRQGWTLSTFIQHSFGSLSDGNQRRKRNKRDPNWKRSKTHCLFDRILGWPKSSFGFHWNILLYIRNPKDATRKPELTNEFGKVVEYQINVQKSVAFLYTENKLSERKTEKIIPFTNESKTIKYLGINLLKR